MAERENRGGVGRLFARARQRMRDLQREDQEKEQHRFRGPSAEPWGERGRGDFTYRETGGGYGGYGGTRDRGSFRPDEGRFGGGYSGYGPQAAGGWRSPEPMRRGPSGPGFGAMGGPGGPGRARHPGEWPHEPGGRWGPGPLDKPRGLGAYDSDEPPSMERGTHPEHPGSTMVSPLRGGGWGGMGGRSPSRQPMEPPMGRDEGEQRRSGPSDERFTDWYGASPSTGEVPRWYGGGVRIAREDSPAQDFAELGGPHQGRFAREPGEDRGRGPGPLGRSQDRFYGEQGRPDEARWRGRVDEYPIYGEAFAGRGHVGDEDTRDLELWGRGAGDRGSRRRWDEQRSEEDHDWGP